VSGESLKLLEHFRNPKNVGVIENADGYGREKNPVHGYTTDIYIKVENEKIEDVKFKSLGCVATIASASALSEVIKGKSLDELVDGEDPLGVLMGLIEAEIGEIPEKNWHCPPTSILSLFTAILDYYTKKDDEKNIAKLEKIRNDVNNYFKSKLEEFKT